jgi:hypothetical protein
MAVAMTEIRCLLSASYEEDICQLRPEPAETTRKYGEIREHQSEPCRKILLALSRMYEEGAT